eukprot:jgi/Astpho2/5824/fgenesh1_pg.00080_%23_73_t
MGPDDNALALLTGDKSDIFALDVDVAKAEDLRLGRHDGVDAIEKLINENGIPPHTPISLTPSGGKHYLFSISKSLAKGLERASNQTKLVLEGKETTIDIRGDGGCIIVYPTKYVINGETRGYTWVSPLGDRNDLPAMPSWLITLLNAHASNGGKRKGGMAGEVISKRSKVADGSSAIVQSSAYYESVKDMVEAIIPIGKVWPRDNGFDFKPRVLENCKICIINLHTSNNVLNRRIISTCFTLINYSSSCGRVNPKNGKKYPMVCGYNSVQALRDVNFSPKTDDPYVHVLQIVTQDAGHVLNYTGKKWICFQGLIWEDLIDLEIEQQIKVLVNTEVIEKLYMLLPDEGEAGEYRKNFYTATEYLKKASNVSSIAKTAKQLMLDTSLPEKFDKNIDIVACCSGVIELRTGVLRKATYSDYLSRAVSAGYADIDYPTPDIDALFASIFNNDEEVISFMQRLLGYGLTGHITAQVWAIWTGVGSNGKSLLLELLSNLLGPGMFGVPPKEVFFQGGKQTQAGGHTAHLHTLKGKLMIAREERNLTDQLDTALIKQMTGGSMITSRAPHQAAYETFMPTHLPILACNQLPAINVDDQAELRRLIVTPFNNIYTGPDDRVPYNPNNPRHRLKDPKLSKKLSTPDAQQQLLTWLVRGAMEWYKKGLGTQPLLMQECLKKYIADNDTLQQFIDECCEIKEGARVNAAAFKAEYMQVSNKKVSQKELQEAMAKRGFPFRNMNVAAGRKEKVYVGLQCTS